MTSVKRSIPITPPPLTFGSPRSPPPPCGSPCPFHERIASPPNDRTDGIRNASVRQTVTAPAPLGPASPSFQGPASRLRSATPIAPAQPVMRASLCRCHPGSRERWSNASPRSGPVQPLPLRGAPPFARQRLVQHPSAQRSDLPSPVQVQRRTRFTAPRLPSFPGRASASAVVRRSPRARALRVSLSPFPVQRHALRLLSKRHARQRPTPSFTGPLTV